MTHDAVAAQPVFDPTTAGVHGGPDAQGVPAHDFSTNSNACGPCPVALAALQACDASRYPDPAYTDLRQQLADFHGVQAWRVVLAGSASEFIYRITAWVAQQGGRTVSVPLHAYGDYAQAARAWGMAVETVEASAALHWHADPSSPLGQSLNEGAAINNHAAQHVLDCAYEPLRLSGATVWSGVQRDALLWQLYSPNKALGMTGVRAAYAIAPLQAAQAVAALNGLCASWPVGAHGVALLQSWVRSEVQSWLAQSRETLRQWKRTQILMFEGLGWHCLPSQTNFFCARPPESLCTAQTLNTLLAQLRSQSVKLRDAQSFGLPGWVRIGVLPPASQDALCTALRTYMAQAGGPAMTPPYLEITRAS
ncbi:MAG: aminotransferase class I/II-fold pyridoxal phosphate-dependent enzyme [Pseudomonadota bacterium]